MRRGLIMLALVGPFVPPDVGAAADESRPVTATAAPDLSDLEVELVRHWMYWQREGHECRVRLAGCRQELATFTPTVTEALVGSPKKDDWSPDWVSAAIGGAAVAALVVVFELVAHR